MHHFFQEDLMLLVVDIGNSHTVTGLFSAHQLVSQWRLHSDRQSTPDELAVRYLVLLKMADLNPADIKGIIIASVVPTLQTAWIHCCERYFGAKLQENLFVVQQHSIRGLISVKLDNPEEVGADRLVNGIGAWEKYRTNLIVIDFGTAITFDCITARCEYLGGAILPGIAISLDALASRTAKLPHIDVSDGPDKVIGKSTVQAMKAGILFGYGAMIDGLVAKIKEEMGGAAAGDFNVIATGGMAKVIAPYATSIDAIDPLLTLYGLQIIYNQISSR
jgi:type III pantothenate kinase